MKKGPTIAAVAILGLILLGVFFFRFFIYDSVDVSTGESTDITPVSVQNGGLTISVDPRVELLSSVQLAGGYQFLGSLEFTYKTDMRNMFAPYKNHNAVQHFTRLAKTGFTYHAPPQAMMYLTQPPSLKQILPYDSELKLRGRGSYNLDKFNRLLSDFSQDAGFRGFFEENRTFYEKVVESTAESLKDTDIVTELEEYYGTRQKSYNLILAPLFHPGGYGVRVNGEDGAFECYALIGPYRVEDQIPVYDGKEIRGLIWHEFSHSFINPLFDRYSTEFGKYSSLYTPIKSIMSASAYPNWETCVNEHLVRAVSTRLAYRLLGESEGDLALRSEKGAGFIYVEELCRKLEEYEENRDTYKKLEDFYPELLKTFEKLSGLSAEGISRLNGYDGPINAAFLTGNPVVLIVPTNEKDPDVQQKIGKYAAQVKERFFKDGKVMEDKDALNEDLSANTVIVYGTVEGNLWLSKYKDTLPFKIEPDQIIADKTYEGAEYRFICGLQNPLNEEKPLLIYTAQSASDIPGINSIMHGSTDYVLAKGNEVVKSGDFNRESGQWKF